MDAVATASKAREVEAPGGGVSLVGIKSFRDRVLTRLAHAVTPDEANEIHASIRAATLDIEHHLQTGGLSGGELTAQSRAARGWLAFFAERDNLDAYLTAVWRANGAFESALEPDAPFRAPAVVEFRLTTSLYRLRSYADGTRLMLATPMICFDEGLFASLARAALNGGSKQHIVQAARGDVYQAIQAELEALSGPDETTSGVHHDLAASYTRVASRYLLEFTDRPRLTWSRTFTGRKFGHYDPVRDAVMMSCTLDRRDVPEPVLDFVMYHELLHRKLGVTWRCGRMSAHTPEFRREEQRFEGHHEAEAVLRRLAREAE
jgi:hypothetical protein